MTKIRYRDFYHEYHGHQTRHLKTLLPELRATGKDLIWLAGGEKSFQKDRVLLLDFILMRWHLWDELNKTLIAFPTPCRFFLGQQILVR